MDAAGQPSKVFSEHMTGVDFYLDPLMVNAGAAERLRTVLQQAIALENLQRGTASSS
jgi:hypothetical protein